MPRKILYSPGYGAGWTTWNQDSKELQEYLLTYQPIIDFLEAGGAFKDEECSPELVDTDFKDIKYDWSRVHPILKQLHDECKVKFDGVEICMLGADDLKVEEVDGRVHITEYDGYESIEEEGGHVPDNYWL